MKPTVFKRTIQVIFIGTALSITLLVFGHTPKATISLDSQQTFQTISGWEVTAVLGAEPGDEAFPHYRDAVVDLAVNTVGINRVRLEIASGAEHPNNRWRDYMNGDLDYKKWKKTLYTTVNDNDDPNTINWDGFDFSSLDHPIDYVVLPMRELLKKRGESLFINLCYVAFTYDIGQGDYIHRNPEEYAEFILATYIHMKNKYGFVPDALEVILEPDNMQENYHLEKWKWDGALIGKAMTATAKRLKDAGFHPRFIAPSITNMGRAPRYIDDIASIPGALEHLSELSYHRYGGGSDKNLQAIVTKAEQYNLTPAMLEWWFGHGTYEVLHKDLKHGNNSSWQGRVLQGLFDISVTNPKEPEVTLKEETRINRQYFNYIRANAVRIGATSTNEDDFDPIAFINENGNYTVLVKAAQNGELSIEGLPAGNYEVSYATGEQSFQQTTPLPIEDGQTLNTSIPDAGVITVSASN